MKGLKWEALILAIGIALTGAKIADGMKAERVVNVKGLAEKEIMANKVTWPLAYRVLGNDPIKLYSEIKEKNEAVVKFLKENGIEDHEIAVGAPVTIDLKAERYSNYENKSERYNTTSVITITSDKIDTVRKLVAEQGELLKRGIATVDEYGYRVSYEYTKLNDIKPALIEEATKNARITAEQFAEDSDSKLGKIRNANQGQISIMDASETTPHIKKVRVVTSVSYLLKN